MFFTLQTQSEIFLTSGKIGTKTLLTIPSSKVLTNGFTNTNLPVSIIIREPYDRFASGIFEILLKSNLHYFTKYSKKYLGDDIEKLIPMYYDPEFWLDMLNYSLNNLPKLNVNKSLPTFYLQFHIGNWLSEAKSKFVDRYNCKIIDISNLTSYLHHQNYSFTVENQSMGVIVNSLIGYYPPFLKEELKKKIDIKAMSTAYKESVNSCGRIDEIKNYLSTETTVYQSLLTRISI